MEFNITTTWDGDAVDHAPVKINLKASDVGNDLVIEVEAPFFNDPAKPGGEVGKPFQQLWDYEGRLAYSFTYELQLMKLLPLE